MKSSLLLICAIALSRVALQAQETAGEKAAEAWDTTKHTAKQVGHTLKRGTKKAANTVKEALTPDPDANRVEVRLSADRIEMPKSVAAGKTAFVVTNTGKEKLNFEVEREGQDPNFAMSLAPNETKVLHVHLDRGHYQAACLIKGRETQRKEVDLRVR